MDVRANDKHWSDIQCMITNKLSVYLKKSSHKVELYWWGWQSKKQYYTSWLNLEEDVTDENILMKNIYNIHAGRTSIQAQSMRILSYDGGVFSNVGNYEL